MEEHTMEEHTHGLWVLIPDQSQLLRLTMDLLQAVHEERDPEVTLCLIEGLMTTAVIMGSDFKTRELPKELMDEAWVACNHPHPSLGTRVDRLFHTVLLAYGYGRNSILN